MGKYVVKRVLSMIPLMFVVSIIVFLFIRLIPGDPARMIGGPTATAGEIAAIRSQLGLDQPLIPQFVQWLGGIFQGDLGHSFTNNTSVVELLAPRLPITMYLTICSITWSVILGVIIGVMSVVVLVAIGQGTTASVTSSIQSMGTNLLTVSIQTRSSGRFGGFGGFNSSNQRGTVILTTDDVLSWEDSDAIGAVSPTVSGTLTVKAGNVNTNASIMGVLPSYEEIRNQGVSAGRYIIQADVDNRSAVCVVGVDIAEDLFGTTDVVGNTLSIDGRKFRIVGVLESKGTSGGTSSDAVVVVPFTLAQRMLENTSITSISVSATDAASVDAAQCLA